MDMLNSFQAWYHHGGFWMHPIAASGAIGGAIIAYKVFTLVLVQNSNATKMMNMVIKLVISGQIDRAIQFCNSRARATVPQLLRAGLTRAAQGEHAIEAAMEEVAIREVPKATKFIDLLGTLANMAPMLGLLGTVIGMIDAFKVISTVAADKRGEMLGAAIAEAMNCTAFGLCMAIPLLFAHGVLVTMADKIQADVESSAKTLLNALVKGNHNPQSQGSAPGVGGPQFGGMGPGTRSGTLPGVPLPAGAPPQQPPSLTQTTTTSIPLNKFRKTG